MAPPDEEALNINRFLEAVRAAEIEKFFKWVEDYGEYDLCSFEPYGFMDRPEHHPANAEAKEAYLAWRKKHGD